MAVGGAGGLLGQLFNPGLGDRLLCDAFVAKPQSAVPARAGKATQPGTVDGLWQSKPVHGAPSAGSNMAPAASTQPDLRSITLTSPIYWRRSAGTANAQAFNEGFGSNGGQLRHDACSEQQSVQAECASARRRRRSGIRSRPSKTSKGCRTPRSRTTSMPASIGERRDLRPNPVAVAWPARKSIQEAQTISKQSGSDEGIRGRGWRERAGAARQASRRPTQPRRAEWATAQVRTPTPQEIAQHKVETS